MGGTRLNPATSSTDPSTDANNESMVGQSELLEGSGALQIGLDDIEDDDIADSDDESGSDISDSEIAPSGVPTTSTSSTFNVTPASNQNLPTTSMINNTGIRKF